MESLGGWALVPRCHRDRGRLVLADEAQPGGCRALDTEGLDLQERAAPLRAGQAPIGAAEGVTLSSWYPVRVPRVRAATRSVRPNALNHKAARRPVPCARPAARRYRRRYRPDLRAGRTARAGDRGPGRAGRPPRTTREPHRDPARPTRGRRTPRQPGDPVGPPLRGPGLPDAFPVRQPPAPLVLTYCLRQARPRRPLLPAAQGLNYRSQRSAGRGRGG